MSFSAIVRRQEFVWFNVVASLILALSSVPYLVGHLSEPEGLKFGGVLTPGDDSLTYLAKIELGRRGNWLFHLPYTGQSHPGVPLIYSYYLLLGHLAHWLHLSTILVFHLARLINGYFVLVLAYLLIVRVSDEIEERRLAFILVGLSSGLGWLAVYRGTYLSTDLAIPESNTFLSLFVNPHFPLSEALMSIAFLVLATSVPPSRWRSAFFISATAMLTFISPYALVTVAGVSSFYLLAQWVRNRRFPAALARQIALATIVSSPIFGLIFYFLNSDPLLRTWSMTQMLSPPIWYYIFGYGLVLVGAVLGVAILLKRSRPIDQMLIVWVGVTLLLLYVPVSLQRRFSMGLHIPLAILAGVGLHHWVATRIRGSRRWLITRAIIVLMVYTNLVVVIQFSRGTLLHDPSLYLTGDEESALTWLREHGQAETAILSSTELGSFVPVFSAGRAVSGHAYETVYAAVAEAEVAEFFGDATSPERRAAILDKYDVAYVIFGPREEDLTASSRDCLAGLTLIARTGAVEIYATNQR